MKPQITGLRVAGVLFGLMSLGQLLRVVVRPTVYVGAHMIPLWASVIAFLIFGAMAFWLWNLAAHTTA